LERLYFKIIKSTLSQVSESVVSIIEILKNITEDEKILADIEIALTEALTNIVKHGYKYDENRNIEINVFKNKNEIVMELIDYSQKINIDFNKKLDYDITDTDSLPEGGMGIYLMKTCMTSLNLKRVDNKNILTMIKLYE